jgi:peptide methionine sulfoxide reductase msrA/msrB
VEYDADVISLSKILDLYFLTIDPTALNHQGEDFGTRYRTGIYYTTEEDLPTIREAMEREAAKHDAPLAVEVEPLKNFYEAEEYHQDYLDKNPTGYCHIPLALMAQARKANE